MLPIIYLNFLLFFRSRVPLITQPGTLLILNLNSDTRHSQFSMPGHHVTYIHNAQWSHAALLISFWIPTCDDHVTHIHDVRWSHATLLISFGFRCVMIMWLIFMTHDGLTTLCSLHFKLSFPNSWNGSISVSAAQTEIDPKMATQADSLFGSIQTLVSYVVMTTLGCAWICKAV